MARLTPSQKYGIDFQLMAQKLLPHFWRENSAGANAVLIYEIYNLLSGIATINDEFIDLVGRVRESLDFNNQVLSISELTNDQFDPIERRIIFNVLQNQNLTFRTQQEGNVAILYGSNLTLGTYSDGIDSGLVLFLSGEVRFQDLVLLQYGEGLGLDLVKNYAYQSGQVVQDRYTLWGYNENSLYETAMYTYSDTLDENSRYDKDLIIDIPFKLSVGEAELKEYVESRSETKILVNRQDPILPAPSMCYSLRKVVQSYSGPAIRVRRSSDNAEQDIGFVDGLLDTDSLLSFAGVNDGFVVKVYDQTGLLDLVQASAIYQPKILEGGVVCLMNGKPCLRFSPFFPNFFQTAEINWGLNGAFDISIFNSIQFNSLGSLRGINTIISFDELDSYLDGTNRYNAYSRGGFADSGAFAESSLSNLLISHTWASTNVGIYRNGDLLASSVFLPAIYFVESGSLFINSAFDIMDSDIHEIIVYLYNVDSIRGDINSYINFHYSIY